MELLQRRLKGEPVYTPRYILVRNMHGFCIVNTDYKVPPKCEVFVNLANAIEQFGRRCCRAVLPNNQGFLDLEIMETILQRPGDGEAFELEQDFQNAVKQVREMNRKDEVIDD